MTVRIPVRRGRASAAVVIAHALVDDEDAHLAESRWTLDADGYVVCGGERRMHREILGLEKGDGLEGDHVNGDRLDNRRENLRAATRGQNGQNVPAKGGTSRHRGVHFSSDAKRSKPWRVRIFRTKANGGPVHVGTYATEAEAAAAAEAWYAEHFPFANPDRAVA